MKTLAVLRMYKIYKICNLWKWHYLICSYKLVQQKKHSNLAFVWLWISSFWWNPNKALNANHFSALTLLLTSIHIFEKWELLSNFFNQFLLLSLELSQLWRILFSRLIHFLRSPRGRKEQGISKVIYISTIRGLYCGSQIVIVEGLLEEDISEIRCYCNIFDNHNLLIISENSVLNVCSAFLYFERNKGINLPGDEWIPSDMQISCPLTFYGDHTWIIE